MRQTCRGVRLIANAIPRLLAWRPVIAQAIGLDHQAEVGPVEVDPEPVYPRLRPRQSQPRAARDRKKAALELGVGERECGLIEEGT
jgi:hypothetical protein